MTQERANEIIRNGRSSVRRLKARRARKRRDRLAASIGQLPAEAQSAPKSSHHHFQPHTEDLWYTNSFDLKERFPISRRFPIRQTFSWFVVLGVIWTLYFISRHYALTFPGIARAFNSLHIEGILIFGATLMVVVLKLSYQFLYLYTLRYRTEGFRLIIERGIILRETGSLPLLPVAEVYVKRGLVDLLFGLYEVHIAVPIDAGKSFAKIEGLSRRHAYALKNFLSAQLSKQVFIPPLEDQRAV